MTDSEPNRNDADPIVSFRLSEWEAFQRHIKGLGAESAPPSSPASYETSTAVVAARPPRHTALYVIGWVLFILQMLVVVWMCSLPLLGFLFGTNVSTPRLWWILGGALIALTVLVHFRFWAKKRPVAVLLSGIFGPTFAWVGAWAVVLSFAPIPY